MSRMTEQIGREFMAKTRYSHLGPSPQRVGAPPPPLELAADAATDAIELPSPAGVAEATDLSRAIADRVSVRSYARGPLALAELSYLLWCTQGVKHAEAPSATFRTVPSAGARHALETYVLANRVDGLAPGIYRFGALDHKLQPHREGANQGALVTRACFGQGFVAEGAATFIWTAVPYRMTWRYGQRGYRYLHLDAGHVCQNLYLAGEAIGCGVCAIGAFDDEQMDRILGLDGREQFTIYIGVVGKKADSRVNPSRY